MKKLISIALVLMLAIFMTIPTFAAEKLDSCFKAPPEQFKDATTIKLVDSWVDGATNARHNKNDNFDYVFLKEDGKGDFAVKFTVSEDAVYDFAFRLMGWSQGVPRATNVKLDDGAVYRMEATYEDANKEIDQYFYGITATLTAGEHTMTFSVPEDWDDTTIKSLYLCDILYVSSPIPATDVPASAATSDIAVIAVAAMLVSAGAVLTIVKSRKA
ncbi:MAG: hypothetical protein HFE63_10285 [Clostridiales bacterium]|nr:hypothetical protein [Clostridiales bacterium]